LRSTVRSLDVQAAPGKYFFSRVTDGGTEASLWGDLKIEEAGKKFHVHFAYKESRIGDAVPPSFYFEGETNLDLSDPKEVDPGLSAVKGSEPNPRRICVVSIEHFQPVVGFRYATPAWSVRLVDENGAPIRGVRAALFDATGHVAAGPFKTATDENGVLRIPDARETLHLYTFVAGHPHRDLFAAANLNRDDAGEIFTIVMRQKSEIPKSLQLQELFE